MFDVGRSFSLFPFVPPYLFLNKRNALGFTQEHYYIFEKILFVYFKNSSRSSSTVPIPAIPNVSIRTFATLGDKNAGNVGPR